MAGRPDGVELSATWRRRRVGAGVAAYQIDLRDGDEVDALLRSLAPEVVVHAAYSMRERADIVDATRHVAAACAATGAALVHLSTDAVFDGSHPPYGEDDVPAPIHDYGRWKLEAEEFARSAVPDVCITRTSLVVCVDPPDPATRQVLDAMRGGEPMRLFTDELRQPILVGDLAAELWALVALDRAARAGVWHLPGAEVCSRFEIGRRVCRAAGLDPAGVSAGVQADAPGPRPRDLTMTATRRAALGHPPRPI